MALHARFLQAKSTEKLLSSQYPKTLANAQAIAEYIASVSSSYVDEEFIEEYFWGTHAILRELPIDSIKEGPADGNARSEAKERRYLKKNPETMPPLVVENGEIEDGNHRYRVSVAQGKKTIWCYVVEGED
jgi:hypothetical protein